LPLYAFTIALSAFLLFLVQPIMARQVLPWFGGSAAVWTTCMMFFQLALLAGYAYSDAVVGRLRARTQRRLHAALLLASLASLPILLNDAWRPADPGQPVLRIVALLAATIGLPYFMLSTTGPLLQAWFARRYPRARVYRLYALSNAASMVGLIAYPTLIEPSSSIPVQAAGWSAGYGLFALSGLVLLWRGAAAADGLAPGPRDPGEADAAESGAPNPGPAGPRQQLGWFGLSALGSILLLAVTAHLTQNVASVPFLWLLPLTLYLLSFILCFDGQGWYWPRITPALAGLACVLMAGGLIASIGPGARIVLGSMPLEQGIVVYAGGLFALCMFLNGQLAWRRPAAVQLTRFYLMLALGGAAGGVFVAVIAGWLFDDYWELPLALLASAAVLLGLAETERARLLAFACLLPTLLLCSALIWFGGQASIETTRNFYGVLKLRQIDRGTPQERLLLVHGNTVHGGELLDPGMRGEPISYYGPGSGVARALRWLQQADGSHAQHVGLVGLGAGVLAGFRRPGDRYRFYEIDPAVAELARRRFTWLSDVPGVTEVRLGDGRLLLESEPANGFRMLVLDAFSSDAVPMHLLTTQAMQVYRRHVDDDGAIVFNISNRYLDLAPVVRNLADAIGWQALRVLDVPGPDKPWLHPSEYVIVTGNERLAHALRDGGAQALEAQRDIGPWTDAYGNIFDVLRVRR
jgi:hypothetical protein